MKLARRLLRRTRRQIRRLRWRGKVPPLRDHWCTSLLGDDHMQTLFYPTIWDRAIAMRMALRRRKEQPETAAQTSADQYCEALLSEQLYLKWREKRVK